MFVIMALTVYFSGYKKSEHPWDFQNYHYYNAFAFLNNTADRFLVPGGVNSFFNPIADVPLYLLIQYFNDNPALIFAIQGIWGGLMFCAIFKITTLFFNKYSFTTLLYALLTVCISFTGRITFTQIGSSTNEVMVAAIDMWSIYFILRMVKYPELQTWYKWLLCGVLMGLALGLKQNSITVCCATGITLLCCFPYIKGTFKSIIIFALGGLIGYLIVNGWFMYQYWHLYGNPFFPFLNSIFKSPYMYLFNYNDQACLPDWSAQTFKYYLWKSTQPRNRCENFYSGDYRVNIYNTFAFITLLWVVLTGKIKYVYKHYPLQTMAFLLFNFSYCFWFFSFSVLRYMVFIEAIAAVMFVQIFRLQADKNKFMCFMFGIITCFFFGLQEGYLRQGPHRHIDKYLSINQQQLVLPDNALVKIFGSRTSFLIPELAKNNYNFRTITYYNYPWNGIGSNLMEYGEFRNMRDKIAAEHKGPIVVIFNQDQYANHERIHVVSKFFELEPNTGLTYNTSLCITLLHNGVNPYYICYPKKIQPID